MLSATRMMSAAGKWLKCEKENFTNTEPGIFIRISIFTEGLYFLFNISKKYCKNTTPEVLLDNYPFCVYNAYVKETVNFFLYSCLHSDNFPLFWYAHKMSAGAFYFVFFLVQETRRKYIIYFIRRETL